MSKTKFARILVTIELHSKVKIYSLTSDLSEAQRCALNLSRISATPEMKLETKTSWFKSDEVFTWLFIAEFVTILCGHIAFFIATLRQNQNEQKFLKPKGFFPRYIGQDWLILTYLFLSRDVSEFLSKTEAYTISPGSLDVMCLVNTSTGSPGTIMTTFISQKQVFIPLFTQL